MPLELDLELEVGSWTFEPGHAVRLDIAGTDWPNAWPPPGPVTLTIDRAASVLVLPVIDGPSPVEERPALPPANPALANVSPKERDKSDLAKGWVRWEHAHEQLGRMTHARAGSFGDYDPTGDAPSFSERYEGEVSVSTEDPGIARTRSEAAFELRFPEATCGAHVRMRIDGDRGTYRLAIELEVSEDGETRWTRAWDRTFDRDAQ